MIIQSRAGQRPSEAALFARAVRAVQPPLVEIRAVAVQQREGVRKASLARAVAGRDAFPERAMTGFTPSAAGSGRLLTVGCLGRRGDGRWTVVGSKGSKEEIRGEGGAAPQRAVVDAGHGTICIPLACTVAMALAHRPCESNAASRGSCEIGCASFAALATCRGGAMPVAACSVRYLIVRR